ncbi:MAG: ATP-binding protein, partial [Anaerolineales bacterium]|nr:ATP-binding protein [Anaerolineales bacterium]
TRTDVAFLFLRQGERLILAGSGPAENVRRFESIPEHKVGECMCGLAVRERRPMYTRDIFKDPRCTWEECKKAGYRSFAALPLLAGQEVIGMVGLGCSEERDFETQAEFLETLAAEVAGGVRNAQLYAELQRYAAELEQKVAERTQDLHLALEKAQEADRLKSAFLATMSHELRTPLNSIIGFTGVLLQGLAGPLNPEQTKQLGMIRDSAQHLLALINDVLDISKIEAGQLEVRRDPFDLRLAIENVLRMVTPMAQKKGLALGVAISSGVGTIVSDQRRVEQILINLMTNAVKFTERGEVRLECETSPGWVTLRVRDTGIGIRPEDMSKLFRPFQQLETGLARHHEGTGLGLAICHRLATLLGGSITAESEWGKGSVFTVTLPLARP